MARTRAPRRSSGGPRRGTSVADSRGESLGTFTSTSYGPPWGGINGPGQATACGVQINGGSPQVKGVAAGINLPCGTLLRIEPNPFDVGTPYFVVWDRGGAIGLRNIDFYDWRGRTEQLKWGRRAVRVWRVGKIDLPTDADAVNTAVAAALGSLPEGIDAGEAVAEAGGKVIDALPSVAQVLADIARFFVGLGELLLTPEGWLRLGKILGGAILVLWGLNRFANQGMGVSVGRGIRRARSAIPGPA